MVFENTLYGELRQHKPQKLIFNAKTKMFFRIHSFPWKTLQGVSVFHKFYDPP